jgi:macrolide-specific efflux system membrane fusion protein
VKCLLLILCLLTQVSCDKKTIHPIRGDIVEAVYGLGSVETEEKFFAKSAITSSVLDFYVTEGQDVVRGQKLFKTDQGAIFKSPINGRVTDIPISIKENVFPQTTVLSVLNLKKLYLSVSLEQQAVMRIKKGLNVEVTFEFFRNKKIRGKVVTIYPSGDQFVAKVTLDQWPSGVLPGMTADVAIEIEKKTGVILIPARAISNGTIFLQRGRKKIKTPVDVGLVDLEFAEIISPQLELNDEVILQ